MYGLFTLIGNVLFFEAEGSNATAFHPKIALHSTYSYKELDEHSKRVVNDIYIHYYYNRQESFWREMAMKKLPAIVNATKMLVCGEDLGMVPDCVPGVMQDLNILSLEIQRMPKGDGDFSHPADAPYLSVVSPSCHDMSTVRGWWEEDRGVTQKFYNSLLGHPGNAPFYCEPWLDQEILIQHLYSPAMWAIFPIQDIVGMDPDLRKEDPKSEQINVPSNPRHYWKYRFHMNIEELVEEETFNNKVRDMVSMSGRLNNF
jgi:4-alpha-glucanotransferase